MGDNQNLSSQIDIRRQREGRGRVCDKARHFPSTSASDPHVVHSLSYIHLMLVSWFLKEKYLETRALVMGKLKPAQPFLSHSRSLQ